MNLEAVAAGYAPRSADVFASRTARKPPTAAALAWATAGVDASDLACLLYTLGHEDSRHTVGFLLDGLVAKRARAAKWRSGRAAGIVRLTMRELPYGRMSPLTDAERAFIAGVSRRQWYARWQDEWHWARDQIWARATRAAKLMRYRAEGED